MTPPRLNRRRLVIGGASSCLAVMAGCGQRGDSRTVVNFWAMGSEGERVIPLVTDFERQNPDIRIRIQQVPWTAAHEKLLTAFAGDTLPDVCQLGNTWLAEFAALGSLDDLSSRIAQSTIVQPPEFFEGIWASNVINGRTFGVPWYVDTRILFYRKDMLAKAGHDRPPGNWDEWMTIMRDVQSLQPEGRYAALLPTNEFEQPVNLGHAVGAEMLKDNASYGNFSGPKFRRAFEFYINIFREGLAPRLPNTQISNVWQEFERGVFAIYPTGPWNVNEFRRRLSPSMNGKWTTAPWPAAEGEAPGASNAGGCSLVLFRQSPVKEAAWKFIEFLSRPESQVRFYELATNLPAIRTAWTEAGLARDAEFAAFHAQLTNVRPAPPAPEWEQIVTGELVKTAEVAINGRVSVERALAALDRKVDAILEKRRWMLARTS